MATGRKFVVTGSSSWTQGFESGTTSSNIAPPPIPNGSLVIGFQQSLYLAQVVSALRLEGGSLSSPYPTPCGDVINCNVRIARAQSAMELDPDM